MSSYRLAIALALSFIILAPALPASAGMVRKVDNFYLLLDTSGSMGGDYGEGDVSSYALAKKLATRMNGRIPELGYDGALAQVAPYKLYQAPEPFKRSVMAASLAKAPEDVRYWFGNTTPLGKSLEKLKTILPGDKAEKSAVILFSDGGNNEGVSPVPVAKALNEEWNGNVCFHVISFASDASERRVMDEIAKVGGCSSLVDQSSLRSDQGMEAFVRRVFYAETPDDEDGDGITDDKDACPGTPRGVAVDVKGCPLDTDGDGVYDYMDECPGTPMGVAVDAKGCPLDTDGDGVYDYMDQCPGTPAGLQVDARGCPLPVVINLEVEFATNKADIKPVYDAELREVAAYLKQYPDTKAEIAGHTDSVGASDYNMGLSQRRADSVAKYLSEKCGVDASRLTAKGYGETKPLVSNDTKEGRQLNRRVEVVVTGAYMTQ